MFIHYMNGIGDSLMAETEKITINIDVVDLGKIDLLVEQGFYSNRTDAIKAAIRQELYKHDELVKDYTLKKSYSLGVMRLSKEELEDLVRLEKKLELKVIGLLIIDEDVTLSLAQKAIHSIKIKGSFKANQDIKQFYI